MVSAPDFYTPLSSPPPTASSLSSTTDQSDPINALREDAAQAAAQKSERLAKLLAQQELIHERAAGDIESAVPFLTQGEHGFLYPNTFNYVQGQEGSFKSYLAETISSVLISEDGVTCDSLGFALNPAVVREYALCYVDTERNITDQFPRAVQRIKLRAGYAKANRLAERFSAISLKNVPRDERLGLLREYLSAVRQTFTGHILIVLDQLADLVMDFNDVKQTMELMDMLNVMADEDDVTILGIIHENPGSAISKPRGHLGTEAKNKATSVLQIGYEKDGNNSDTGIVRMTYLKCREGKRGVAFCARYDEQARGLVSIDGAEVEAITNKAKAIKQVDAEQQIANALAMLLQGGRRLSATLLKTELLEQKVVKTSVNIPVILTKLMNDPSAKAIMGKDNTRYLLRSQGVKPCEYYLVSSIATPTS